MSNKIKLTKIIQEHKLTRQTVADMLLVQKSTVDNWLAHSTGFREMPDNVMELLEIKIRFDLD